MPQDETAFAQFYARHVDSVYRICLIQMRNQMDAEDLTQETFLRAMDHPEIWEEEKHARAWLIVTASNLCKNALHHWLRSKRSDVEDWESALGTTPSPEEQDSPVLGAVMKLPDQYRTVLYLFYYEGYSGTEIAEMLHKKESTVRSLLHRGRKQLEKNIGGEQNAEHGAGSDSKTDTGRS